MTKKNLLVSAVAVMAAAVAGVLMKKRGQIKVEGELETRGPGGGPAKSARGSASMGASPKS